MYLTTLVKCYNCFKNVLKILQSLNLIKKKLRITALHPSLTYSVHIPAPLPPVIPHTVYIYHKARGKRQHFTFGACLRGGGGPQVSEVTRLTAVEK